MEQYTTTKRKLLAYAVRINLKKHHYAKWKKPDTKEYRLLWNSRKTEADL